jgi:hypothetical protein
LNKGRAGAHANWVRRKEVGKHGDSGGGRVRGELGVLRAPGDGGEVIASEEEGTRDARWKEDAGPKGCSEHGQRSASGNGNGGESIWWCVNGEGGVAKERTKRRAAGP